MSAFVRAGTDLAEAYEALRRTAPFEGHTTEQADSLALISGELGQFCAATVTLLNSQHWGPAFAFARLVNERAEYLLALCEDVAFAKFFWDRSTSLSGEEPTVTQNRSGEARGRVRKLVERRADSIISSRVLSNLIGKHDNESFAVHPSVVGASLTCEAGLDASGSHASTAASTAAFAIWFALAALLIVCQERSSKADTAGAQDVMVRVRPLFAGYFAEPS